MDCKMYDDDFIAYLDGTLPPEARVTLEAHLEGCSRCQEELARTERALAHVDQHLGESPPVDVRQAFAKVTDTLRTDAREQSWLRRRWWLPAFLGAGAVAAVVALVVGLGGPEEPLPASPEELEIVMTMEILEDYDLLTHYELLEGIETEEELMAILDEVSLDEGGAQ